MDYNKLIRSKQIVLVEFYASWCPHCQRMMPIVDNVKKRVQGDFTLQQIDVDRHPDIAEQNGIDVYPTFIIYKYGAEAWRKSGELAEIVLLQAIEDLSK